MLHVYSKSMYALDCLQFKLRSNVRKLKLMGNNDFNSWIRFACSVFSEGCIAAQSEILGVRYNTYKKTGDYHPDARHVERSVPISSTVLKCA